MKEKLIEHGWDAGKIAVLPHFQKLPAQASRKVDADAPILYFGRLSPEKGLTDLLQAMQQLPHVPLRIAGEGPQRAELGALAKDLGLANVEFVGRVGGVVLEEIIAGSAFTVLPSRAYETFGKSILESYAWGRAVVASDLGSRRELVHEGETGLLFRPGDVGHLAEAISFLYSRPEIAVRMGESGRTLVREQYTPEKHYLELTRLYERMALLRRNPSSSEEGIAKARPLHIAFISGRGVMSKYSGIETYYEEVGQRLVAMGHHVTGYCRTNFTPPCNEYRGMRLVRLPTVHSKHFETVVHTTLSTIHALFSRCDIVHYPRWGRRCFRSSPAWPGKRRL